MHWTCRGESMWSLGGWHFHSDLEGMTCVVGFSICFTGIWAQRLISATSFLAPCLLIKAFSPLIKRSW